MVSKETLRIVLWMAWTINLLVTSIHCILNFTVFYKLSEASSQVSWSSDNSTGRVAVLLAHTPPALWRSPMAAALMGALLVLGFNVFSCIILLKRSMNRSGPGFGYGFLVAFCFTLSIFCLLCGLVLQGFQKVVSESLESYTSWTQTTTQTYYGAEAFAFITFAELFLFFLALVVFQGAVTEQLGIDKDMANPYSQLDPSLLAQMQASSAVNGMGSQGRSADPNGEPPPQYNSQYNNQFNNATYGGYNNNGGGGNNGNGNNGYNQNNNNNNNNSGGAYGDNQNQNYNNQQPQQQQRQQQQQQQQRLQQQQQQQQGYNQAPAGNGRSEYGYSDAGQQPAPPQAYNPGYGSMQSNFAPGYGQQQDAIGEEAGLIPGDAYSSSTKDFANPQQQQQQQARFQPDSRQL
ncbi:MAG: hypothetical protein WDW38_000876 [Sanguina aurantia]